MFRKLKELFKGTSGKGFTLIEVVIVLAIAGLIFVIIFLAVSSAQRARRDNARQDAANRLMAAAEQSASNNNGAYPANGWNGAGFFNNTGNPDAGGGAWVFNAVTPAVGTLVFDTGTTCAGAASARVARVRTLLEGGAIYCRDNN